ncbi:MAG TPA: hypothetical protein VNA65_00780, partial [Candidatus Dormibacteraeota bacterium]|nr:hypothetical protein [Candidatus Dormibacteraeota bacterium]
MFVGLMLAVSVAYLPGNALNPRSVHAAEGGCGGAHGYIGGPNWSAKAWIPYPWNPSQGTYANFVLIREDNYGSAFCYDLQVFLDDNSSFDYNINVSYWCSGNSRTTYWSSGSGTTFHEIITGWFSGLCWNGFDPSVDDADGP